MWVRLFIYSLSVFFSYSALHRMIEYKNGSRVISPQSKFYKETAELNIPKLPKYTFNIVLYDCTSESRNDTVIKTIYTYMYSTFFKHIQVCSNNTITKMDTFIYGPYHYLNCSSKICSMSLLDTMEERSLLLIDQQYNIPYIVSVFIKPHLCDYIAVADIGGHKIFINGLDNLLNPSILFHEWGHNLGLRHATTVLDDYGDPDCAMGRPNYLTCFNAPHSHLLKWITAKPIQTNKIIVCKTYFTTSNRPFVINSVYYVSYVNKNLFIHKLHDPDIGNTLLLASFSNKNGFYELLDVNITWRFKKQMHLYLKICKVK